MFRQKNFRRKEPLFKRIKKFCLSRKVKYAFKGLAALSLVIAISFVSKKLYDELLNSPLLQIKEIEIQGVKRISRDEILELSDIRIGDNILAADVSGAAVNIKKHPWIESLRIKRKMPQRLVLEIKERSPLAFINLDELYLIDESGAVFKRASLEDDLDMPVISAGLSKDELEDNERVSSLVMDAVNLIKLLDGREIFGADEISEIKIDLVYGLTLYTLNSGTRIEIGKGDFLDKLERMEEIIKRTNTGFAGIVAVELNYGKKVIVKMQSNRLQV